MHPVDLDRASGLWQLLGLLHVSRPVFGQWVSFSLISCSLVEAQVGSKAYPEPRWRSPSPSPISLPARCGCVLLPTFNPCRTFCTRPHPAHAARNCPMAPCPPLGSSDEWRWRGLVSAPPHRLGNVKRHLTSADRMCLPRLT